MLSLSSPIGFTLSTCIYRWKKLILHWIKPPTIPDAKHDKKKTTKAICKDNKKKIVSLKKLLIKWCPCAILRWTQNYGLVFLNVEHWTKKKTELLIIKL